MILNKLRDLIDLEPQIDCGDTHEALCPRCNHWTGVTPPAEDVPPNGQHKCKSWCVWCGKEFIYYY